MNVVSLLAELAHADIRLWLDDSQLRFSAPEGAMTEDRLAKLRANKIAIVDFLSQSLQQQSSAIEIIGRDQLLPLSFAQQRLWFLNRLEPDNSAYHIHAALKISGPLDTAKLQAACQLILQRHEILRSVYTIHAGKTYQSILPAQALQLQAEPIAADALDTLLQQELNQPFDLNGGPILRLRLLQLEAELHVLSFTIHHIASDGWSMGIFVSELIRFYQADSTEFSQAECITGPQYADFAYWQQHNTQQQKLQQSLEYWSAQLQEVPITALPLDYERHNAQSNDGHSLSFNIDANKTQALQLLCQSQGATLFMGLLSLYALLLHKRSGQHDFAIGSPVAGRSQSQLEQMMGCFVNVLALRFDIDSTQSFQHLLQQTMATASEAFKHQDLPFEQVVNALELERDMSINPVFQTLLVLQNSPLQISDIDGLSISPIEQSDQAAQFDLSVSIQPIDDVLRVNLLYKKALFNTATVQKLSLQLQTLLDAVLAQPTAVLNDLAIADAAEQQALIQRVKAHNETDSALDFSENIQALFERQAATTPEAIAVYCGDSTLSYQALNQQANQLAHYLIAQGIKANDRVMLHLDANHQFMIAVLAVIKASACYIPVDSGYPAERCQFIAEQSAAKLIISNGDIAFNANTLPLTQSINDNRFVDYSKLNPPNTARPDAAFYCIYTSGSTGTPKGVEVLQAGTTNLMHWYLQQYTFKPSDKFLLISSIAFDLSQKNFFAPLCVGASLVFPDNALFNPQAIRQLIQQQQITAVNCAPSVLQSLLPKTNDASLQSLRVILLGGEPISRALANAIFSHSPCRLINMYGPTECTDISCCYEVAQTIADGDKIYIGKAISNVKTLVLDHDLSLCPVGKIGELYISGGSLARGYIGLDELNATSFVMLDPLKTGATRFYKSGDLCRLSHDGNIEYIGRVDEQVKVRGLRIELGEIEQNLLQVPGITQALLKSYNDKLAAYYSSETGAAIDSQIIRQALASRLPHYMLPQSFTLISDWPLNANGKINKRALPKPDFSQQRQHAYVAANSESEKVLVAIWQHVLQQEKIGILDNFFDLGGHSLTAAEVFSLAQDHFQVDIALKEIFDCPTIQHIASVIDAALISAAVFKDNSDSDDEQESFIL